MRCLSLAAGSAAFVGRTRWLPPATAPWRERVSKRCWSQGQPSGSTVPGHPVLWCQSQHTDESLQNESSSETRVKFVRSRQKPYKNVLQEHITNFQFRLPTFLPSFLLGFLPRFLLRQLTNIFTKILIKTFAKILSKILTKISNKNPNKIPTESLIRCFED